MQVDVITPKIGVFRCININFTPKVGVEVGVGVSNTPKWYTTPRNQESYMQYFLRNKKKAFA